ncbi:hypothetical protein D0T84_15040 [Dysgonomonas sp. 521]|uniref:DUF6088 family protein n=1 Tax=Dysgonomonas sp. 521 TaxID=2302932 RepID=UPI0013D1D021|nr:DUF6088 family protein [Dysgonomonas sp. 521]NDV96216.1 hypothetical protein [Dysgonomonas sp. 521]
MTQSLEKHIINKIKKAKRGKAFFVDDFLSYGNSKACAKALERLVQSEQIVRIGRGIYSLPKKSKLLGAYIMPTLEDIAKDIARREKARIIPAGLYAMNMLGLSTQVPLKAVYLTDGTPRKLEIGGRILIFKKTTPKNLSAWGEISGLVIQALKAIGKKNLTESIEEKIIELLKKEKPENISNDIKLAPEWIRVIMRKAK